MKLSSLHFQEKKNIFKYSILGKQKFKKLSPMDEMELKKKCHYFNIFIFSNRYRGTSGRKTLFRPNSQAGRENNTLRPPYMHEKSYLPRFILILIQLGNNKTYNTQNIESSAWNLMKILFNLEIWYLISFFPVLSKNTIKFLENHESYIKYADLYGGILL